MREGFPDDRPPGGAQPGVPLTADPLGSAWAGDTTLSPGLRPLLPSLSSHSLTGEARVLESLNS